MTHDPKRDYLLYQILLKQESIQRQQEVLIMLSTQLKAATDALTAEVATVISQSSATTPDVDVQAGIDAVTAATASLSTAFPKVG